MARINKLIVLGGGSTYTPELLSDFIEHQGEITVEHVSLYDLHAERLVIIGGLAQRRFQRAELTNILESTQDLSQAAETLTNELLDAHRDYLPQFFRC